MLEKRKTMKNVIVAGAAVAVMLVGAASAYFTSTDVETNTWTIGSVDVELEEAKYDQAVKDKETENITPMQELAKDPKVKNTGDNDAYVFVEIIVPKANVITAEEDGTKNAAAVKQLFTFEKDSAWTLVNSNTSGTDVNKYVYAYGSSAACTALNPNATTSSVIKDEKITFINVIEDQVKAESLDVVVNAYAIQTTNLTSDDKTDPTSVWAILNKQTPAATAKN